MASTVAHNTALKKGQRIHANASDTARTSNKRVRSSRLRILASSSITTVANTCGKRSHDPCEVDARKRHADETSVCRNENIDSGQCYEQSLVVRRFQVGIA